MAFYIKELLLFSRRNDIKFELPLVEDMWIKIKTNHRRVVVGVGFRHPTNSTCRCEKFSENFLKMFYAFLFKKFSFYVVGDFNIDLHKVVESNFVTKHAYNLISLPCKCAIDLSTRITDHSKRLIQHIYVNDFKYSYIRGVVLSDYITSLPLLS